MRGRQRSNDRGRRGRRNDYFRGQYGRYKQKNEYQSSFSNPSFSETPMPQQKPVKILKRPKESTVPVVSPKSNKMNGAHHKKSHSLPSTPSVNKSRFPTMAEDKNTVRINPMLTEYMNATLSNGNSPNKSEKNSKQNQYESHMSDSQHYQGSEHDAG